MTMMFFAVGVLDTPPAIAMSCSTVVGADQRIRARLADLPVMKTFRLLICLDDDGDVRVLDELVGAPR